jgi:hypothetical protein
VVDPCTLSDLMADVRASTSPRRGAGASIHRRITIVPDRLTTGVIDAMSWPAGESVSGVEGVQCTGEIACALATEAEDLLCRW